MKRLIFIALVIPFCLISSGCASKEQSVAREPLSFQNISKSVSGSMYELPVYYQHLNEIMARYRLHKTIVIRGKKEGLSTPIDVYDNEGWIIDSYCETKIRVSEAFYGDIKAGDLITLKEFIQVVSAEDGLHLIYPEETPPLEENQEYILILPRNDNGKMASDGSAIYSTYSMHHSHHKISDYQNFKQKVENATATAREIFGYEVLDYYLNEPDTRLDLYREASQYVENLSETASQEEILAALPEEQRVLFTRLIAQYGVKS